MALKAFDAGDYLILSVDSREEVEGRLAAYESRVAKVISEPVAIGSHWAAACTLPDRGVGIDISDRLTLSELWEAASRTSSDPVTPLDDGCRVEEVGFKRIIRGPTKVQVMLRVQYFTRTGANVVGDIEQDGGVWVAIIDTASTNGSEPYQWAGEDQP